MIASLAAPISTGTVLAHRLPPTRSLPLKPGLFRVSLDGTAVQLVELRGALTRTEAARYLGISLSQLHKRVSLGEIKRSPDHTYPIAELERYLRDNLEEA